VTSSGLSLESAVSSFGRGAKTKLTAVAAKGAPEDQLRNPFEQLLGDLAELCGLDRNKLTLVGESSIAGLHIRPDFAISYANSLVGFIEVKAPGKGADPRKFKDPHDREQWKKLAALPNLIYTDGNAFSLWRSGELVGEIRRLVGDIETAGAALAPTPGLLPLFNDFLSWVPITPNAPAQLAEMSARLCRLLRDEVTEQLQRGNPMLTGLAKDWRKALFPQADDQQFADGYAQAVTFGLLLARARGISLDEGVEVAARALSRTHSLIGSALRILTDAVVATQTLPTSVATLSRVLAVVDWPTISKGDPDAWLYFYEDFLAEYDKALRRQTGSYYTPVAVVKAMTRLVNEGLEERFGLSRGLASPSVTLVDPAVGTGTFLLEVIRSIAATVADDEGAGAIPGAVTAALGRLIGFEVQLGPFAVAQLRVLAELVELGLPAVDPNSLRMYVTNSLDNPFVEEESLGTWYDPIAESRRQANRIKKDEPVLVVLGNPPYRERSHGAGGWVESGNPSASQPAPLASFLPPPPGVSARTSSTCTTPTCTFGAGRRGRSLTSTRPTTVASCASSRSPASSTAPASSACATTCAAEATPSTSSTAPQRATSRRSAPGCSRPSSSRCASPWCCGTGPPARTRQRRCGSDGLRPVIAPASSPSWLASPWRVPAGRPARTTGGRPSSRRAVSSGPASPPWMICCAGRDRA
jgi:hypothetical protein